MLLNRRAVALVMLFAAALIGGARLLRQWAWPSVPVVFMVQTNGLLRAFPAFNGVCLILPDGSLWRWGEGIPGEPPVAWPQQVGVGHHWKSVFPQSFNKNWDNVRATLAAHHKLKPQSFNDYQNWANCVGLDSEGRIWRWFKGWPEPGPFINGTNWTQLTGDGGWYWQAQWQALQRDGTAWAWRQSGARPGNVLQIQTNDTWRALSSRGPDTFAVRKDGTWWYWNLERSTPVARLMGNNWMGVQGSMAWDTNGDLADSMFPFSDLVYRFPVGAFNFTSGKFAFNHFAFYSIRPDGTLWSINFRVGTSYSGAGRWVRLGNRSDWLSVSSDGDDTFFGLTADGTVWTWGLDIRRRCLGPGILEKLCVDANALLQKHGLQFSILVPSDVKTNPWPLMRLKSR